MRLRRLRHQCRPARTLLLLRGVSNLAFAGAIWSTITHPLNVQILALLLSEALA